MFIEADEDHVPYQNGKNKFMKLVYVHEGIRERGSQHELINPHYFTGEYRYSKNDVLWDRVFDYVNMAYDLSYVENIYLSGDGAPWIRAGLKVFTQAQFIIDAFHITKYVKQLCVRIPNSYPTVIQWIYDNQFDYLNDFMKVRLSDPWLNTSELKTLKKAVQYLRHFSSNLGIHITQYNGCSAEGHVSHILSDRLSSRPKGWGTHNASVLARLRACTFNKTNIYQLLLSHENKPKRRQYNITKIKKSYTDSYPYENVRIPVYDGAVNGTYRKINQLTH